MMLQFSALAALLAGAAVQDREHPTLTRDEVREDGVRHRYYPLDEVPESVTVE